MRFGGPPKLNVHRREALARREKGETLMEIAPSSGVSRLTIMRLAASNLSSTARSSPVGESGPLTAVKRPDPPRLSQSA